MLASIAVPNPINMSGDDSSDSDTCMLHMYQQLINGPGSNSGQQLFGALEHDAMEAAQHLSSFNVLAGGHLSMAAHARKDYERLDPLPEDASRPPIVLDNEYAKCFPSSITTNQSCD